MKTRLLLFVIFAAGAVFAAESFKAEKIKGDPLGFWSAHKPVASWRAGKPENHLIGSVSNVCAWTEIQSVQIIQAFLHIRGPGDTEAYIKNVLADAQFLEALPKSAVLPVGGQDSRLDLQALLKLKDGTYALLSVTDRFAVIEHNRRLGLIQWW